MDIFSSYISHSRKYTYIHFSIIPNENKSLFLLKSLDYSLKSVFEELSIFVTTEKQMSVSVTTA